MEDWRKESFLHFTVKAEMTEGNFSLIKLNVNNKPEQTLQF